MLLDAPRQRFRCEGWRFEFTLHLLHSVTNGTPDVNKSTLGGRRGRQSLLKVVFLNFVVKHPTIDLETICMLCDRELRQGGSQEWILASRC